MFDKQLNNVQFQDFIEAFQLAFENREINNFKDYIQQHQTEFSDPSVQGVIFYLETHQWDFNKLQHKLTKIKNKDFTSRTSVKGETFTLLSNRNIWIAASLVLVGLGFLVFSLLQKPSLKSFIPEESGLPNMMNSHSNNQVWFSFQKSFADQNYQQAFLDLQKIEKTSDTLQYYIAITQFKLENFNEASQNFKNVSNLTQSIYKEDAAYYAAISMYQNNKKEDAKKMFKLIANDTNHSHQKMANEFLKTFF